MAQASREPHVAIDLRILDGVGMERTGMGRYALELARGLQRARPGWRLTIHSNRPELLGADGEPAVRRTRWPTASAPGRVAWLHVGSALTWSARAPDVWFSPSFVLPLWWRGPSLVAVHDLSFQLAPEHYRGRLNAAYAARATRFSARRADRVLCGSRETKARLVEHLGIDPERIGVIPYGVSEAFLRPRPVHSGGEEDFLLFVGTFEARKGLEVLHAALRRVNGEGARVRLVLAGSEGWGTESELRALLADPLVEVVRAPSDDALSDLYGRALALVYPSRMEGFGLPVAEAMAAGCPVIASDLGCIREFASDVPLYAPPGDVEALAEQIERLLDDPERPARMSTEGRRAAAGLRWDAVAELTAGEIERELEDHGAQRASRASS
jgi:glycosyltransferase involved in cell wall biosynthesis